MFTYNMSTRKDSYYDWDIRIIHLHVHYPKQRYLQQYFDMFIPDPDSFAVLSCWYCDIAKHVNQKNKLSINSTLQTWNQKRNSYVFNVEYYVACHL